MPGELKASCGEKYDRAKVADLNNQKGRNFPGNTKARSMTRRSPSAIRITEAGSALVSYESQLDPTMCCVGNDNQQIRERMVKVRAMIPIDPSMEPDLCGGMNSTSVGKNPLRTLCLLYFVA